MNTISVVENLTRLEEKVIFTKEQVDKLRDELDIKMTTKTKVLDELYLNGGALEVANFVLEKTNERNIDGMTKLIQRALSHIFTDRDFKVDHVINSLRGSKQLDFFITENKNGVEVRANVRDAMGDGVRSVVGIVIIHFYISITNSLPLIILDEVVSAVASRYIDNLFSFLELMGKEGDFIYLFISHDPRITPYVDKSYRMVDGSVVGEEIVQ